MRIFTIASYIFIVTLFASYDCRAQNSTRNNQIVKSQNHLFGVMSQTGELFIDTIYGRINIIDENSKRVLPVSDKPMTSEITDYYLVTDIENKKAIFDSNGKILFDFIDCNSLQLDTETNSVVLIQLESNKQLRSYLYKLDGHLVFKENFESIAFIKGSNLIALIVEDGAQDEYYIYNNVTGNKIGPFDHFNIYNSNSQPPIGMQLDEFVKYKKLNVIAVRKLVKKDYLWGIYDLNGNEILPIEFKNMRMLSEADRKHIAFRSAKKPEGVDFLFKCSHFSNSSVAIYFDCNFAKYEHRTISIPKREYIVERI
jgi:hypothetical protein